MPINGIKCVIFLSCCIAVCSAFFGAQSTPSASAYNVCVFSKDPSKYSPTCYPCPQIIYLKSLKACMNTTAMPTNITYDSATCMEKNCQINYPTPKPLPTIDKASLFELLGKIFSRPERSIIDGSPGESMTENEVPQGYWNIIKTVNTCASDSLEIELDYPT